MDTLEAIHTRRSIRKYMDVPVEWDKIGQIIYAGKAAPSAGNLQNWKFVIVTELGRRQNIAHACLQQHWMITAPVHIVVVAEPEPAIGHYGVRGERLYSVQNCAAAVENMLLAAHAQGLGSCWVGAFDEDMLKRSINCTERVRPQAVVTIGYADEKVPEPDEYTFEDVSYWQKWKTGCTVFREPEIMIGQYSHKVETAIESGKGFLDRLGQKGKSLVSEGLKKKKGKEG